MSESPANPPSPDGLRSAIEAALAGDDTPRRAIEIARRLGVDRGDVNRALYANPDRFSRNHDARWSLADVEATEPDTATRGELIDGTIGNDTDSPRDAHIPVDLPEAVELADSATMPAVLRRPGPFGPARSLLPKHQTIRYVEHHEPIADAIERMLDDDLSQLPVRRCGRVVGVVSWRDLPRQLLPYQEKSSTLATLLKEPVSSFMEQIARSHFVAPTDFIDTTVDWIRQPFVFVGTTQQIEGVLTISDVWSSLNQFAETFVILNELETALRDLIDWTAGDDLTDWLTTLHSRDGQRRPTSLGMLQFSEYRQLVTSRSRWPRFESAFNGGDRALFDAQLERANDIRNRALHFRGEASQSELEDLRRLLKRIRAATHPKHL